MQYFYVIKEELSYASSVRQRVNSFQFFSFRIYHLNTFDKI